MTSVSAHFLAVMLLTASFATACADSSGDLSGGSSDEPSSKPSDAELLVDLKAVVSSGKVQPGDGIRTAGQPTAAALKVFADNGFKTVIDLRGKREKRGYDEKAVAASLGLNYQTLPISGSGSISFDNARKLDVLIQQSEGPILIHCASGNRVGALLALRASMSGAGNEAALQTGRSGGLTGHDSTVRQLLEKK